MRENKDDGGQKRGKRWKKAGRALRTSRFCLPVRQDVTVCVTVTVTVTVTPTHSVTAVRRQYHCHSVSVTVTV
jgi:hypothetical protein